MLAIYRFLFPSKPDGITISLLLLALRILFGGLLLSHGIQKWNNYAEMSAVFPDPLGVGSNVSLGLAIFGELACSIGFIFGALYRLAMIPMIFTMCMAFFVIHGSDPFAVVRVNSRLIGSSLCRCRRREGKNQVSQSRVTIPCFAG